MNKKTREALEGSIHKWEDVRDGKRDDSDECKLCNIFAEKYPSKRSILSTMLLCVLAIISSIFIVILWTSSSESSIIFQYTVLIILLSNTFSFILVGLLNEKMMKNYCIGCPVYLKTKEGACHGSPYIEWKHHQKDDHNKSRFSRWKVECPTCKKIADQEVQFLKSLRSG